MCCFFFFFELRWCLSLLILSTEGKLISALHSFMTLLSHYSPFSLPYFYPSVILLYKPSGLFKKEPVAEILKGFFPLYMQSVYDFKHRLINSNYQVLFLAIVKVFFLTFVLNLGSFQFDGESALPHELRRKVFTLIYWVIIFFCRHTYVVVHRNVEAFLL